MEEKRRTNYDEKHLNLLPLPGSPGVQLTNRESIFDEGQTVTDTQKAALANYIQPTEPKKDKIKKEWGERNVLS